MRKHNKSLFFLITIAVIVGFCFFLPWKNLLETRLKSYLSERGLAQLEFHITSIGMNEIRFSDIAMGSLTLPDLNVGYSPINLIRGNFEDLHSSFISFQHNNIKAELENIAIDFSNNTDSANDEKIIGKWQVSKIIVSGSPLTIPELSGAGKIELAEGILKLSGNISSRDKTAKMIFLLTYPLDNKKEAAIAIKNFSFPWNDGLLYGEKIYTRIYDKTPIPLTLRVSDVSLNALLATATSGRGSATGSVSGTLPVIINRDGSFSIERGELSTPKNGKITLPPEFIPSDAPQVAILREVLSDFDYDLLSISISSASSKQIILKLSLQGKNAHAYDGRQIKFNVNLVANTSEQQ